MPSNTPTCLSDDAIQALIRLQPDQDIVHLVVDLDEATLERLKKSRSSKVVWLAYVELDRRGISPCDQSDSATWQAIVKRWTSVDQRQKRALKGIGIN